MLKELGPIFLVGIAEELLWIASYAVGPFRDDTPLFLLLMMVSFALCLWAFFRLPLGSGRSVVAVLVFAFLFRITVLPSPPHESEDVYRYLWDAKISSSGINPFQFPPNAPALEKFKDGNLYPLLNSKSYITAYPPLSQVLFRFSYELFGESVIALKAIFSVLEFSTLLLAWRLLVDLGQHLEPLYLLAWHPFFVLEFSHSGHSDSAMMFLTLLSICLLRRSKKVWAMVSYAGAVLVKLHPGLWFPLYIRRGSWKGITAALLMGSVLIAIYFTPTTFVRYIDSLRLYFRLFEFNASVHYLLRFIGREFFGQSWDQVTGPYLASIVLLTSALLWWKFPVRNERDLLHAGFWIMTVDLCLNTTVHPWYLSWAAVALPVFPYAFMVYWTGASALSYYAYAYRPVYEPTWVLLAEYLPMYALMAWEIYRRRPLLESWLQQQKRQIR